MLLVAIRYPCYHRTLDKNVKTQCTPVAGGARCSLHWRIISHSFSCILEIRTKHISATYIIHTLHNMYDIITQDSSHLIIRLGTRFVLCCIAVGNGLGPCPASLISRFLEYVVYMHVQRIHSAYTYTYVLCKEYHVGKLIFQLYTILFA